MADSVRGALGVASTLADRALDSFEALGGAAQQLGFGNSPLVSTPVRVATDRIDVITNTSGALQGVDYGRSSTQALRELARGELPGTEATLPLAGPISKGIQQFGNVFNATTGVLELAAAYKQDRQVGDQLNSGFLKQTIKSTAQISASSIAGGAAFAVAAGSAALGGAVVLPVVLGVGAACAAGYAVGKAFEWMGW